MPEELRAFNMDIFYGNETNLSVVISAAKSFPMMADRRIVILRDLSASLGRSKKDTQDTEDLDSTESNHDGDVAELLYYFEKPNPSTVLVITDTKLPGNTKLGKLVTNNSHIGFAKFEPINENQLPQWIQKWTQFQFKVGIEPQASMMLVERIGSDVQAITGEINKIANGKKTGESITVTDIDQHVLITKEINIFDLKDAINRKDLQKSLKLSNQMLHNSKTSEVGEVLRLLAFFYSYYGNIWQILRLTQKGVANAEIRSKVGIKSEYYFNNLVKESKLYSVDRIFGCFEAVLDADKAVKGFSKLEPSDILVMFIRRVC